MSAAATQSTDVSLGERLSGTARVMMRGPAQGRVGFRSPAALAHLQRRRVTSSVTHAAAHVPYYRETIRRLGLSASDFRDAADLGRLPIIERSQLQADPEYFSSDAGRSSTWVHLESGGSTGEPVTVFRDPASVFDATIHAQRMQALVAGFVGRFRFREVVISSGSGDKLAAAFRRSSLISPAVRSERMHLSLFSHSSEYVEAIDEFKPEVIRSYGSLLEELFVHMEATGRHHHRPKVVTYSGDAMSDAARGLITGLGIRVLSAYQAIESGQVGFECEQHRGFHVNTDFCPVRIIDPDGRHLPDGDSGEVVVSDLTNRATILLNYRLGDLAATQPACTCGRHLPMISLLKGRSAEWLTGPSGERLHPQTALAVLRFEPEVRRYQVVQLATNHIEVSVVLAPGADKWRILHGLETALAGQFPPDMRTTVRSVQNLRRTPGGKVMPVVPLLKEP